MVGSAISERNDSASALLVASLRYSSMYGESFGETREPYLD